MPEVNDSQEFHNADILALQACDKVISAALCSHWAWKLSEQQCEEAGNIQEAGSKLNRCHNKSIEPNWAYKVPFGRVGPGFFSEAVPCASRPLSAINSNAIQNSKVYHVFTSVKWRFNVGPGQVAAAMALRLAKLQHLDTFDTFKFKGTWWSPRLLHHTARLWNHLFKQAQAARTSDSVSLANITRYTTLTRPNMSDVAGRKAKHKACSTRIYSMWIDVIVSWYCGFFGIGWGVTSFVSFALVCCSALGLELRQCQVVMKPDIAGRHGKIPVYALFNCARGPLEACSASWTNT